MARLTHESLFTVDRITADDLPRLALIYEELAGAVPPPESMLKTFRAIDASPDYYLLGARTGEGLLVGTVMGLVGYDLCFDERPFMVMENMVVAAEWNGRGAGRALLTRLEEIAEERNCVFIQFCSSWFRTGAHSFYESMGYDPGLVKGYRKFLGTSAVHLPPRPED